MPKNKEVMNTKEVSAFLKLHPFTVNKLAREGKIPAFKIGVDWRFYRKHLDRWIKEKVDYQQQGMDRRKKANGLTIDRQQRNLPIVGGVLPVRPII